MCFGSSIDSPPSQVHPEIIQTLENLLYPSNCRSVTLEPFKQLLNGEQEQRMRKNAPYRGFEQGPIRPPSESGSLLIRAIV